MLHNRRMKTTQPATLEEKYLLGIPEIDAQHKELADLVAKFKEAVTAKDQRHLIPAVLRRIHHHLSQHFLYEEKLMEMVTYADLSQHRKTHKTLLKLMSDHFDHPIAPADYDYFCKLIGDKILGHVFEHDAKMIATIKEKLPVLPRPEEVSSLG